MRDAAAQRELLQVGKGRLDRREGLNLSHRFSCAVSELWVAGYFGGQGRTVGVFGGIGRRAGLLKRTHHISTGPQDLFAVIR